MLWNCLQLAMRSPSQPSHNLNFHTVGLRLSSGPTTLEAPTAMPQTQVVTGLTPASSNLRAWCGGMVTPSLSITTPRAEPLAAMAVILILRTVEPPGPAPVALLALRPSAQDTALTTATLL